MGLPRSASRENTRRAIGRERSKSPRRGRLPPGFSLPPAKEGFDIRSARKVRVRRPVRLPFLFFTLWATFGKIIQNFLFYKKAQQRIVGAFWSDSDVFPQKIDFCKEKFTKCDYFLPKRRLNRLDLLSFSAGFSSATGASFLTSGFFSALTVAFGASLTSALTSAFGASSFFSSLTLRISFRMASSSGVGSEKYFSYSFLSLSASARAAFSAAFAAISSSVLGFL